MLTKVNDDIDNNNVVDDKNIDDNIKSTTPTKTNKKFNKKQNVNQYNFGWTKFKTEQNRNWWNNETKQL